MAILVASVVAIALGGIFPEQVPALLSVPIEFLAWLMVFYFTRRWVNAAKSDA